MLRYNEQLEQYRAATKLLGPEVGRLGPEVGRLGPEVGLIWGEIDCFPACHPHHR